MTSTTREILTLQVGAYANFVGAHFWNAQDIGETDASAGGIDHNVLFQTGENLQGETTLTPRLVVVDTKDHLGYLSASALLGIEEEMQEATPAWQTVRSWSDYLRLYLHPKSLGSGILPKETRLDWFAQGADVWQQTDAPSSLIDDELRWFAEACDYLQGFHIMADTANGYGGYTAQLLAELRDEYGKSDMIVFGVADRLADEHNAAMVRIRVARRTINQGFATTSLSDLATTYVPVTYPHGPRLANYLNDAGPQTMGHVTSLVNQREHHNLSTLEAMQYQMMLASQNTRVALTCIDRLYTFAPTFPDIVKRHHADMDTASDNSRPKSRGFAGFTSALEFIGKSKRTKPPATTARIEKYEDIVEQYAPEALSQHLNEDQRKAIAEKPGIEGTIRELEETHKQLLAVDTEEARKQKKQRQEQEKETRKQLRNATNDATVMGDHAIEAIVNYFYALLHLLPATSVPLGEKEWATLEAFRRHLFDKDRSI
ncbi:Tubulin/FtsZ, GTPase domain-containing protein [Syncephalis pseudoplumigaleata]|uniref:Tubulin/FtsZ, GTPase domain-containing protein n=1 Tax=Syncephalis pseudoplumigaleata TaxID=1712513 RepID=A0A4P9Z589_9FUNG|nr:Tubulin/FtsZ, GTPase domain-containing protein [Syncephalis pseudoplumigaleata]|eukprot:RKP27706.1 Tubulin/FtsZ, GTPase domain-containing protein [Syncephalis pseudoplumigaleata]